MRIGDMEYGDEIPEYIQAFAKNRKVVICYGGSDDLFEMRGASDEELGAWIGDKGGVKAFKSTHGREIIAEWCRYGTISWTYKTDIPSESFIINEDGRPYCIGLVFRAEDGEEWGEGI
ncbi:MAG: hypothetical protein RBR71_13290 [Gudongella sp.]|nr:hypothetical protein [Gudongella sp.]